MFNQVEEGFIFVHQSGKFLARGLNRGSFDKTHFVIRLVDTPEQATIFEKAVVDNVYNIEYRTLFAEQTISECTPKKIKKVWSKNIFGKVEFEDE